MHDARERLAITGVAALTPWGEGLAALREGLHRGQPAYGPLTALDCRTLPVKVGGWIPELAADRLGRFHNKLKGMGKYVKLGVLAAQQAMAAAGLATARPGPERIGAFVASGTHGHNAEGLFPAFAVADDGTGRLDMGKLLSEGIDRVHPWWLLATISNNLIFFVTHFLDLRGANSNYCNSAVAGAYALDRAAESLRRGEVDVALVGGADTPLNWQALSDLAQLGLLAEGEAAAVLPMRPFAAGAAGTVLSEAAVFLVLERAGDARQRGARVLAYLDAIALYGGFAQLERPAADGHETARVLGELLAAVPAGAPVQVNASAVAVPAWDAAEATGLRAAVAAAPRGLPVTVGAARPLTGHAWSLAFLINLAASLVALQDGQGLALADPAGLRAAGLVPAPAGALPHDHAVALGQCFGGSTAGALLTRGDAAS